MTAFGREEIDAQKTKKQFFSQYILYSLKAHVHYFTVFIYLETWRGAKIGVFTYFTFTNLPWCSHRMNSLICVLYTNPQLITNVVPLLRTAAAQKSFLYYPLMGLCFWPWNFHQQGQGFHSREIREFVRGSGKFREK